MLNKAVLIGRLTREPELKYAQGSGTAVTTFTLAVDRNYKDANGEKQADFIPIVAWRKLAETAANNLNKGRLVAVSGAIQTRNYEAQDGTKRYVTEIVADSIQFLDYKEKKQQPTQQQENDEDVGFTPTDGDDDIPF